MSRYVLFAILALVAILTLRGVSSSWDTLGQLDPRIENAPAENAPETQTLTNNATTGAGEGAVSLDQAGQNVRRLASQNAEAIGTQAQDNFGTAPIDADTSNPQASGAGATGVTETPAPTNQDPIPALW